MEHQLLGEFSALFCAFVWAFALVLFKKCTADVSSIGLNLFKNVVGLILLFATLIILRALGEDGIEIVRRHSTRDILILLVSGVIGIALADTLFFHALDLIGVGLISIVDCAYAPFAVLFSWLLLGETLTPIHYVGGALIVVGVFVASRHDPPPNRTRRQIITGMLLAPLAVGMMAFGIVMATPVLKDFPVMWATTTRLLGGTAVLILFGLVGRGWKTHWRIFRPAPSWRYALPASVLGSYVSLIFWITGFKYTYASIAAILNQTSVVFASILAVLILKERFSMRKAAALALAVAGVVVVRLSDWLQSQWAGALAMLGIG
jgi:drug/metabolite transporter (DMT)-like permease